MNEKNLVFVLGRNWDLSVAEIKSVFEKNKWKYEIFLVSREILILSSSEAQEDVLCKTLGGTVKIGKIVTVLAKDALEDTVNPQFLLQNIFTGKKDGKIEFGISVYDGGDRNGTEKIAGKILQLSKNIKRGLKDENLSARFLFNKERFLSSVTVDKNKLIKNGAEILIIPDKNVIYVGKTLFVQEYEEFSRRDYGRPVRDLQSGVMPPKLARMMINIAGIDRDDVLLDPFCGSGTILQEAVLLGYKKVIGRDVSEKAIHDTKENLEWLKSQNDTKFEGSVDVKAADVKVLSESIHKNSVHGIVAEPYLGPTLHGQISQELFKKVSVDLAHLYTAAFLEFRKVLVPGGVVVFILPVFAQKGFPRYLELLDSIEKSGFKKIKLGDSPRGSILVGNRYDFVLREIVKFKKV